MSVPKVYSSLDANAPQLPQSQTINVQPFYEVLRECLVNGYKGVEPAGWSIAYDDVPNNILVLQQGAGNKYFLQLSNPYNYTAGSPYTSGALVRGFTSMQSETIGSGMFPSYQQIVQNSFCWSWLIGACIGWRLIASDKLFFFETLSDGTSVSPCTLNGLLFFGDFKSNVPNDRYNCILYAKQDNQSNTDNNSSVSNNSSTNYQPGTYLNLSTSQSLWSGVMAGPFYQQDQMPTACSYYSDDIAMTSSWIGFGNAAYPDFISNTNNMYGINIVEGYSGDISYRGRLPGLFMPSFNGWNIFGDGSTVQGAGSLAGNTFMCWCSYRNNYNNTNQFWFNTSNWDD